MIVASFAVPWLGISWMKFVLGHSLFCFLTWAYGFTLAVAETELDSIQIFECVVLLWWFAKLKPDGYE